MAAISHFRAQSWRGLHAPSDPGGSDVAGLILGRDLSYKNLAAGFNDP